jgi:hypothetical protein
MVPSNRVVVREPGVRRVPASRPVVDLPTSITISMRSIVNVPRDEPFLVSEQN